MKLPAVSLERARFLLDLQKSNPEKEVVGYLKIDKRQQAIGNVDDVLATDPLEPTGPEADLALLEVNEAIVVAYGDDDKVAYREHRPYVFHTHPVNRLGHHEPPSGEDLLQALSWGYPDYNAEKKHSELELVVASEGLWWYTSRPELRQYFYGLQDADEQRQCDFLKLTQRYLVAVVACYQNGLIALERFISALETLQFSWMAEVCRKNPGLLSYLRQEFPLEAMNKICTAEWPDCPGFFVVFVPECVFLPGL